MSLIYVTGISGAGKSAVCEELGNRGYEAHEADNTLSAFYDNDTGEIIDRHVPVAERTPEWRAKYTWKMSREKLLELKQNAAGRSVFVCGVAANEEEYIDVFDKVFALVLDLPTVAKRLQTRTTGDFGKSDHEMQMFIEWHSNVDEYYRKIGARLIDATKPLAQEVDEILAELDYNPTGNYLK